jgi:hypothetical protein
MSHPMGEWANLLTYMIQGYGVKLEITLVEFKLARKSPVRPLFWGPGGAGSRLDLGDDPFVVAGHDARSVTGAYAGSS